jgi:hypothetical protein
MMNTQATAVGSGLPATALRVLRGGSVVSLGSAGGKLEVLHGRVWVTRSGDPDDHFVDFGHSVVVPASGRALVEALDDGKAALIAWRPQTVFDRVAAGLHAMFDRCWEIVDAPHRIGAGVAAALLALVIGALVFGPLSEARTRSLAAAAVLHNGTGANPRAGVDAAPASRGARADASAGIRERARGAAQEARRGPAGAA